MNGNLFSLLRYAIDDLSERKQVDCARAVFNLQKIRHNLAAIRVLCALNVDTFYQLARDGGQIFDDDDLTRYQKAVFDAIETYFPLDRDQMWEAIVNDPGSPPCLIPEYMGFPFGYDEMCELMDDPSEMASTALSLDIFLKYLDMIPNIQQWESASEYFGWHIGRPGMSIKTNFDLQGFFKRLQRGGLTDFIAACKVIWSLSDNVFIDNNPYEDYEHDRELPFTIENVHMLAAEYERAKPLLSGLAAARQRIQNDPHLYKRLLNLFERSLAAASPNRMRVQHTSARTLAEIWGMEAAA